MIRVPVPLEMLSWACERAGHDVAHVAERVPQLWAWVRRERQPTLKRLERLAKVTHTPLGYLFLPGPPEECLPVPDSTGRRIDHEAAVSGNLRLVPSGTAQDALAPDYANMLAIGMLLDEDEPFGTLMQRCALIEERADAAQAV